MRRPIPSRRPLYFAAGSTAFTPAQISNLAGWYDASDSATITLSGSAVTDWADKSGTGNHLTQTTGSLQPTYTTAAHNGLNAVTFTATDYMDKATPINMNGQAQMTVLGVVTVNSAAATARVSLGVFGTVTNLCWYLLKQTNQRHISSISFNGSTESTLSTTGTFSTANVPTFCGMRFTSAGNWSNYLSTEEATATGSYSTLFNAASAVLRFGAGVGGAAPWIGNICEIVIYNRYLTSAEVAQIKSYLVAKWAAV